MQNLYEYLTIFYYFINSNINLHSLSLKQLIINVKFFV